MTTADLSQLRGLLTAPPPAFLRSTLDISPIAAALVPAANDLHPEASGPRCTLRLLTQRGLVEPEVVCYRVPYQHGLGVLMEAHTLSIIGGPEADGMDVGSADGIVEGGPIHSIRYYHRGRRLRETDTPESLRMGDDEMIEVGTEETLEGAANEAASEPTEAAAAAGALI